MRLYGWSWYSITVPFYPLVATISVKFNSNHVVTHHQLILECFIYQPVDEIHRSKLPRFVFLLLFIVVHVYLVQRMLKRKSSSNCPRIESDAAVMLQFHSVSNNVILKTSVKGCAVRSCMIFLLLLPIDCIQL